MSKFNDKRLGSAEELRKGSRLREYVVYPLQKGSPFGAAASGGKEVYWDDWIEDLGQRYIYNNQMRSQRKTMERTFGKVNLVQNFIRYTISKCRIEYMSDERTVNLFDGDISMIGRKYYLTPEEFETVYITALIYLCNIHRGAAYMFALLADMREKDCEWVVYDRGNIRKYLDINYQMQRYYLVELLAARLLARTDKDLVYFVNDDYVIRRDRFTVTDHFILDTEDHQLYKQELADHKREIAKSEKRNDIRMFSEYIGQVPLSDDTKGPAALRRTSRNSQNWEKRIRSSKVFFQRKNRIEGARNRFSPR